MSHKRRNKKAQVAIHKYRHTQRPWNL